MNTVKIDALAERIKHLRLGRGIREVANEVGISPATLSRIENGKIPDLDTFGKICSWLGDDPALYLGVQQTHDTVAKAQVHFKKKDAITQKTAEALSEMIMFAQQALINEDEIKE
jgi:transcriptional regulator with XRE-family HTH domain